MSESPQLLQNIFMKLQSRLHMRPLQVCLLYMKQSHCDHLEAPIELDQVVLTALLVVFMGQISGLIDLPGWCMSLSEGFSESSWQMNTIVCGPCYHLRCVESGSVSLQISDMLVRPWLLSCKTTQPWSHRTHWNLFSHSLQPGLVFL